MVPRFSRGGTRAVPRLLIVLEYDQSQMAGPPFAVFPDEVETLFSARHRVAALAELDVLADWPQTRTRGLASMLERVYRLDPK
jgi:thiopurine S-methyltransferase